ncbi:MAG: ATP-binding cassette domain-containing protein [Bacteroidia bacterium]|nr:ATP-binding cassette domain-containing protein [Bacteroidia bacterium]NNF31140.1 ATP-binding cassette domain-containing protein [Flavobacteriaceae bacterium]MBT8275908.1 ATP-binding cassette domain-containing protein [Bacteroidia bacterium]NNJ80642.1 ATP-binding cassette domain-containing protein [Flavobacteriaceae bacterium]NNK55061.1 ATP-binding cassette domain-containing protein [Flavobacteriaceae bacterium]
MINIHNLSVSFQGDYLFEGITFQLTPGDRVGLVGKNGAGKSTLLRIIAGEQEYDEGQIATDKKVTIGFLKQDIDFTKGRTVLEEAYEAFSEIKTLEKKLESITMEMSERTDYESESYHQLMVDMNELQHQYEIIGGYNYQGDTERILKGLGFIREDFNMPTDTFSGGWRMRIELAKLLLQNNDILLLDEPTNHLDIESILWLEEFLNNYAGVVMLVSHDRMFLDNITNRTIEISLGKIYDYNQPYTKYLALRHELRTQQLATQKNQQKHIEHTEKLIEKFRAKASKATMAQSLIKKLDRIERIEVDEDDTAVMSLRFPVSVNPGKVVIEAENISKHYGDNHVLSGIDLFVERGSKIAFVGQNGQGKSTLAKILVNEIDHKGSVKLGHNVQIGYFAQNQVDYLEGSKTVEDTMLDAADEKTRPKVRNMLGAFLFRGDEVDKYVKVLSGGERNRLALAKLLLQPFNVLVMDEPTNHLDMKSKNVLKDALKSFGGTLIVVSHDRDFLQGLSNKVYEFKDRKIKEYLGDIDYFLEQRNLQNLREAERRSEVAESVKVKTSSGKEDYEQQKKRKSLQNKLSKVESEINKLEREIKEIDIELQINYNETIARENFFDNYQQRKQNLDKLMQEWTSISEQLDSFA